MNTVNEKKKLFSTRKMVIAGLFVALSYAVSLFEFPIFPATPYLKLDFSNVFILLTGFLFGSLLGICACVIKEMLCLIGTSSGGAGQVANALVTIAYIIVPCTVYKYKKGIKTVIITLIIACILGTGAALIANRFVVFPLYMGASAAEVFSDVFWYVTAFNVIKTLAVSIVTTLLYKRLSVFIKRITA
ncbi:MAG: ECF transporter S component [Oscillospiraceae bacterium]|nr:ECF transporter S component [Oscillospiraceae bacterium]